MPVKLARPETAVVAFVHRQAARMLMHQVLDQFQVVAALRRRFQQLRFEQLVESEQSRIAPQLVAHQADARLPRPAVRA